jgi:hypothetical protein
MLSLYVIQDGKVKPRFVKVRPIRMESPTIITRMTALCHQGARFPDFPCSTLFAPPLQNYFEPMNDIRPQMLLGFGPDGFSGHPDHIAVCAGILTMNMARVSSEVKPVKVVRYSSTRAIPPTGLRLH